MQTRRKNNAGRTVSPIGKATASPQSLASRKLPPEMESSHWNFDDNDRLAYSRIDADPVAKNAFKQLTTGTKSFSPSALLLSLSAGFRNSSGPWKGWDEWNDKWKGLQAITKSLRTLVSKMEKHMVSNDRGPIPLPTLVGAEGESENYTKSHLANQRLAHIAEMLTKFAAEIEGMWQMREDWLQRLKVSRKDIKDIVEKEKLVKFLRIVQERTGEPHYEHIATLLNAVRGTYGSRNELSADNLRKLSNRLSTPFTEQPF